WPLGFALLVLHFVDGAGRRWDGIRQDRLAVWLSASCRVFFFCLLDCGPQKTPRMAGRAEAEKKRGEASSTVAKSRMDIESAPDAARRAEVADREPRRHGSIDRHYCFRLRRSCFRGSRCWGPAEDCDFPFLGFRKPAAAELWMVFGDFAFDGIVLLALEPAKSTSNFHGGGQVLSIAAAISGNPPTTHTPSFVLHATTTIIISFCCRCRYLCRIPRF
ncbi:hypothetical protein MAPG_08768, partial [Magnaporthiopsis poae ATCC 64411]